MDYIIAGGLIVSSAGKQRADLLVADGRIAAWVDDSAGRDLPVVDATGRLILPGVIDAHTHFHMASGDLFTVDDFVNGGALAVSAGVTSIVDFIEPLPWQDLSQAIASRFEEVRGCPVDYQWHLIIPHRFARGTDWHDLMEWYRLTAVKGFTTYREDGLCLDDDDLRALLNWAAAGRGLLTLHAEDDWLLQSAGQQLIAGGDRQMRFFPQSRPALAEQRAIERALGLPSPPASIYFVHISTAAALGATVRARQETPERAVWMETCPQYLALDQALYEREDSWLYSVCPPLRTREDRQALWDGLRAGLVDVVASDHCPYTVEMKRGTGWASVRPGLPAVDAILPVLVNLGVAAGRIGWEDLVRVTAENPARIFRLQGKGSLVPGSDADCLVIDPAKVIRGQAPQDRETPALGSRAGYSPFSPAQLGHGWLEQVIRRGEFLVVDGKLADKLGEGRLIPLR